MNNNDNAMLELSAGEKRMLRSHKITHKDIPRCTIEQLQSALRCSKIRAMEIIALHEFQTVPSIGIRFAHDLVSMGYYSLKELKNKNPVKLYDDFEKRIGAWADPCLEDQFRLVVGHANGNNSNRNWWDYTAERKTYREKYGYASTRPRKPWYQLEQYKKSNRINAKSTIVKNEVVRRVRQSMVFIKKNYSEKITLKQLSEIALLSPFHFQRSFKLVYEQTPLEFITHLRLKKACHFLKNTKRPVNDIAMRCGFENSSSFIRLFKRRFVQTPATYRSSSNNESV